MVVRIGDELPLSMVLTIQMFMLLAGSLIVVLTRTDASSIAKNEVFRAGMVAVIAVFGAPASTARGAPEGAPRGRSEDRLDASGRL